jgi:anti-anti-sigma factor
VSLRITVVERRRLTLVVLDGELDVYTARDLRLRLEGHDAARRALVIDLRAVTFVDSAGLSVLVHLRNEARRAGRGIGLVCPGHVRSLLSLTGLSGFALDGDVTVAEAGESGSRGGPRARVPRAASA